MVSKFHSPEITVGAAVPCFPNNDGMLLEEEECNKQFGISRNFTSSDGFSSDDTEDIETENSIENTKIRWTKELNKIAM